MVGGANGWWAGLMDMGGARGILGSPPGIGVPPKHWGPPLGYWGSLPDIENPTPDIGVVSPPPYWGPPIIGVPPQTLGSPPPVMGGPIDIDLPPPPAMSPPTEAPEPPKKRVLNPDNEIFYLQVGTVPGKPLFGGVGGGLMGFLGGPSGAFWGPGRFEGRS